MSQIKGKQILNSSIDQSKFNVTTESIIDELDVTNVEYVNANINSQIQNLTFSNTNKDMAANVATVGELATATPILEFPISTVEVKVNNLEVNVGAGKNAYFSPDGFIIRKYNEVQRGDYLYWNSSEYDLDADDEIDFNYLVAVESVDLEANSTIELNPYSKNMSVKFTGDPGDTVTVILDGVSFIAGNVAGNFVWDISGDDEYTFTVANQSYLQLVNEVEYTIWFDGFGSLIFSVKEGNYDNRLYTGKGFDSNYTTLLQDNYGRTLVFGGFSTYNETNVPYFVRLLPNGDLDDTFNTNATSRTNGRGLAVDGDLIYAAGPSADGMTQLVCYNDDGSTNLTFDTGTKFDDIIHKILIQSDGKILALGSFSVYDGVSANNIIRLNPDGTRDTSFNVGTGFDHNTHGFALQPDGKILVGCDESANYNGTATNGIIRLNTDGSIDTSFIVGSGFNNSVETIAIQKDGKIVVGGLFTSYKSEIARLMVRLNTDGSTDATFNFPISGRVDFIRITNDNKYYAAGLFASYDGSSVDGFIKINNSGTIDPTFINPSVDGVVYSLVLTKLNKLLFSGSSSYAGSPSKGIFQILSTGTADVRFDKIETFKIRMTVSGGNLGTWAPGVYDLNPDSYTIGPENWTKSPASPYTIDNLKLVVRARTSSYDYLTLSTYVNGTSGTHEWNRRIRNSVSGGTSSYIDDNSPLFKTYTLGGTTVTFERL